MSPSANVKGPTPLNTGSLGIAILVNIFSSTGSISGSTFLGSFFEFVNSTGTDLAAITGAGVVKTFTTAVALSGSSVFFSSMTGGGAGIKIITGAGGAGVKLITGADGAGAKIIEGAGGAGGTITTGSGSGVNSGIGSGDGEGIGSGVGSGSGVGVGEGSGVGVGVGVGVGEGDG